MQMDPTSRDALARNLCARITSERRTKTELDVIDLLLAGIESHESEYGGCDADSDKRNCLDERDQEMQDGLFYHLLEAVKRRARRRERIARFITADRHDDWEDLTSEFHRSAASSGESPTPCDTPPTSEDAAPIRLNKLDRACSECGVEVGEAHESDCAWVVQVPANSEVA